MSLDGITFRPSRDALDADRQYDLWFRATEGLPFAWASSLANARFYATEAAKISGSRMYAENAVGELVGYIGTTTPFEWAGLGRVAPTGFPWTAPQDAGLEEELYSRMMAAIPEVYEAEPPGVLMQRFRSSWTRQHEFVASRGWTVRWREPIMARGLSSGRTGGEIRPLSPQLAPAMVELAAQDPVLKDPPTGAAISQRFARGWWTQEMTWVCDAGAFSFQVRGAWAEIKFFTAVPGREEEVLAWMSRAARAHGASGVYFTFNPSRIGEMERARKMGFVEKDADVYVGLDLG